MNPDRESEAGENLEVANARRVDPPTGDHPYAELTPEQNVMLDGLPRLDPVSLRGTSYTLAELTELFDVWFIRSGRGASKEMCADMADRIYRAAYEFSGSDQVTFNEISQYIYAAKAALSTSEKLSAPLTAEMRYMLVTLPPIPTRLRYKTFDLEELVVLFDSWFPACCLRGRGYVTRDMATVMHAAGDLDKDGKLSTFEIAEYIRKLRSEVVTDEKDYVYLDDQWLSLFQTVPPLGIEYRRKTFDLEELTALFSSWFIGSGVRGVTEAQVKYMAKLIFSAASLDDKGKMSFIDIAHYIKISKQSVEAVPISSESPYSTEYLTLDSHGNLIPYAPAVPERDDE